MTTKMIAAERKAVKKKIIGCSNIIASAVILRLGLLTSLPLFFSHRKKMSANILAFFKIKIPSHAFVPHAEFFEKRNSRVSFKGFSPN